MGESRTLDGGAAPDREGDPKDWELDEAREQLAATSAILRAIASSPTDIKPVLKIVTESAAQLCDAYDATILLRRGEKLVVEAHYGSIDVDFPDLPISRDVVTGRAFLDRETVHVHDLHSATGEFPEGSAIAKRLGFRTILSTPLLREDEPIGALMIRRAEVRPFGEQQIRLLATFADQAVIAIENVRLFEEVQRRTRDLEETLERQTATSEILRIISTSPTNAQPVFETIVSSAVSLCGSLFANVFRFDGKLLHHVASQNVDPRYLELLKTKYPMAPDMTQVSGRVLLTGSVVRIEDALLDQSYDQRFPTVMGWRRMLGVPLLRDGDPIGVLVVGWSEAGPVPRGQEDLLRTFADQAVIAIENVRLFDELQARTEELTESLRQQTATADVLKAISRSTFDLRAVLETLLESAVRLCDADHAWMFQREGDQLTWLTSFGHAPDVHARLKEYFVAHPLPTDRGSVSGRAVLDARVIHVPDVLADPDYQQSGPQRIGGYRAALGVPLVRDGAVTGVIFVAKSVPQPFSASQIELVTTFADQAQIALENARLVSELHESLQRQTATADVLKAISRSTFDLKSVLNTLVQSAAELCAAERATITRQIDGVFYRTEAFGHSPEFMAYVKDVPVNPDPGSVTGRALLEKRVVHIPDVDADSAYTFSEARNIDPYRTMLGVPMMREGVPLGVLALTRSEMRPFTEKEIELVSTFADQAAIAIENVRLFDEVEARTEELSRSLEELRTAQDRLVQTEKLASLGQLTAGIAHEIKNPLNFVNNFSSLSAELVDELGEALRGLTLDAEKRGEIEEVSKLLRGNLEKIVQHGKRADSIVKNMLLHSRSGSGEHRPADINAIVEESLNLAYHGARAEKRGFNIAMEKSLDPEAGEVDLYPQEITRVLLNLISNGFYAATKRKERSDGPGYEPTLTASTKSLGDSVEICIRDNGTGIPPDIQDKLFNPFFTTKPVGEGTGLGLSLSHDIVVKQHAGTIEVDTKPGAFTEFRIVLPRGGASLAKSEDNA